MHYVSQLGWGNSVLCHCYYQGLPNWIQDPISTWEQGKPTLFQDMYTLAMTIDHCYWEWDRKRHCARQVEKEALESYSQKQGKASTSSSVMASQSKANCASIVVQETTSWTPVPRSKPWCFSNCWYSGSCFRETLGKIESDPQNSTQTEGHIELPCAAMSPIWLNTSALSDPHSIFVSLISFLILG